ncbi:hypothetical protein [Jiulongibacter sediminis]|uniref:hypothetical protein n=1 Tax=Jiulongibacter sediminis TaxID=1605367 RepID=UPI0026EB7118|nr:hypothetical protein [Jiulongibacter sediminis]
MSQKTAAYISYLFYPGLIPTYLLAVLYFVAPYLVSIEGYPTVAKLLLLFFVLLYTFIFPSLMVYWLYKRGQIKSLTMEEPKERRIPYLITVVSSGFLAYFFAQKSSMLLPSALIIGLITLVIALVAVINLKWKISAHSAAIGGVIGAFFTLRIHYDESLLNVPFFTALFIGGLVLSARLKLNAHTPLQIAAGFLLGLFISIFGVFYI